MRERLPPLPNMFFSPSVGIPPGPGNYDIGLRERVTVANAPVNGRGLRTEQTGKH